MSLAWAPPKKSTTVTKWDEPDYAANAEMGYEWEIPFSTWSKWAAFALGVAAFFGSVIGILVWRPWR